MQIVPEKPAAASGTFRIGGELKVHRLGFGSMRLTGDGIWGPPEDKHEAIAVLRRALDLGVDFIDTADSYRPNVAESLIAEALYPYPKDLVIATKGGLVRTGPNECCEEQGIGFIPWAPLAFGNLAQPGSPLDEIAREHNARPAQVALAWLLKRSSTLLPIPGTSNVEHLEQNAAAATLELSRDEYEALDRSSF